MSILKELILMNRCYDVVMHHMRNNEYANRIVVLFKGYCDLNKVSTACNHNLLYRLNRKIQNFCCWHPQGLQGLHTLHKPA
jgi:hypothetical protein